jgi:hypothetical protein
MSKTMIIAAAVSALVIATPAFAQDRGKPAGQSAGFGGRNGSATSLRDAPRRGDEAQSTGFGGRNGSATNLRDAPRRGDEAQSTGFGGRNGSATDLRDAPRRGDGSPRTRSTNNLKQVGIANH